MKEIASTQMNCSSFTAEKYTLLLNYKWWYYYCRRIKKQIGEYTYYILLVVVPKIATYLLMFLQYA